MAITSFFIKSPKKKDNESDTQKSGLKEPKGKEKVTDVSSKEDVRILLHRKSIRATPSSVIPDPP